MPQGSRGRSSVTQFDRRRLLAVLGAGLTVPRRASAEPSPQDITQRLARCLLEGRLNGLHTLLVSQGGQLLIEHYGRGEDEDWGQPLGMVIFAPDVLHDLRSVSKSVVALVYGIALAAGKV